MIKEELQEHKRGDQKVRGGWGIISLFEDILHPNFPDNCYNLF